jgi:hypothetical protein
VETAQQQQQSAQQQQQPLYFQVVLPPPSSGHAEFVILQSRFEASLQTTWQAGDRVQVRSDVPTTNSVVLQSM